MKNPFRSKEPVDWRDAVQMGSVMGFGVVIFFLPGPWAGLAFFTLLLLVWILLDRV